MHCVDVHRVHRVHCDVCCRLLISIVLATLIDYLLVVCYECSAATARRVVVSALVQCAVGTAMFASLFMWHYDWAGSVRMQILFGLEVQQGFLRDDLR